MLSSASASLPRLVRGAEVLLVSARRDEVGGMSLGYNPEERNPQPRVTLCTSHIFSVFDIVLVTGFEIILLKPISD